MLQLNFGNSPHYVCYFNSQYISGILLSVWESICQKSSKVKTTFLKILKPFIYVSHIFVDMF